MAYMSPDLLNVLNDFIRAIIGAACLFIAIGLFRVGWRILTGDKNEYDLNREAIQNPGSGNDRLEETVAIDPKTNEWKIVYRFRERFLKNVFKD